MLSISGLRLPGYTLSYLPPDSGLAIRSNKSPILPPVSLGGPPKLGIGPISPPPAAVVSIALGSTLGTIPLLICCSFSALVLPNSKPLPGRL